jgi:pimeloyl-ACP methyl ester carboxylesterase
MVATSQTVVPVRYRGRTYRLSAWFRDTGEELMLFVHGLGCSKDSWREAWSHGALSGRSLLAFDLPGFGSSPRPADFDYALKTHAELLAAVIDANASRRICLVTHSMGGAIAMLLPAGAAGRISSLVLVEGRLCASSCGFATEASSVSFEQFDSVTYPRFRRRMRVDPRAAFDLDRADRLAFYRSSCSLVDWASGDELLRRFASFGCPRAYVYGADNRHLEELADLGPGLVHEIGEAGHFVMNDCPDAFYEWLGAWVT